MIRKIRKLIPHSLVNYAKHLPEAVLANIKYGFPGRRLKVIGVTGTDGKTTTVNMIYKILHDAGKKASMISTINAVIAGKSYDTGFHVTSPHSSVIQKYFQQALKHGDEFMVLEVTSHALDQFRVWGVPFEIGVITNITHEHLDYHKTFENYFRAKAKLIQNVKFAVLNADDVNFSRLSEETSGKVISFGMSNKADINTQKTPLKLRVPGDYNICNALASAAVGKIIGLDDQLIRKSLEGFSGLCGRMEEIKNRRGIRVFVDFAHTPNALENALQTLRPKTSGKLIAVFGCASQRDKLKRPLMGKISGKLADVTILTDEDPRFEDRNKIIEEIAQGAYQDGAENGKTLYKEPDRTKAIKLALSLTDKGDVVGIFGKGHEKSMNYHGVEKPWSDQEAVRRIIQKK
ncbi:MAG: UDP-N-acetylmuramyl-tripeptide synthetase [Candidatus Daviesbacteria bacterium GW2011_GWA1_41_61]|uniref:UDP-N-acetylmuramyl-tripeptide synthetase n=1 Tax=Candidatus Daviesbacteria bacterium GW2011_GWA2_40_9 TaxID=1618424 RepID=A0A0G0X5Q9_9BACT|nr:MAG: UDP-N-acetylmuramyl-tripeptide synthetase [Candidatus Daviesbacteria bacterium GW2011_GWC1_40_9]KKR82982.1 MAG: UDP-N-acetylmuramyl-tripeptide synthetase [Candidatus Daviesbacteria bacterium GW2011_GWA2_40_9]KKR92908.1 MAG: UDP-N-acetylmuramyl-tripeptide synthetase [Candidatus Daviesbacteria bacterium GW2011_GWB1_41_15]KKS15452.1 MAG: UDP-N-acetylmuramyl-tripeptide synthetase [Candidatus Daviesbacteria bacterium GW2011_GWA1_41_61]